MKVFIAVPKEAHPEQAERIARRLRSYGHFCTTTDSQGWLGEDELDFEDCDALVLGTGWAECPLCRNLRYDAVNTGKTIAYESDLTLLNPHTLRHPAATERREYRTFENADGVHVQVKGRYLGLWHTVKTYRDAADPAYARLQAAELFDKLTDD